jgi:hypothetical protein
MRMKLALSALLMLGCLPAEAQQQSFVGPLIQPQTSSAVESSHIFKTTGGTLAGFQVNNTAGSSLWAMVFDASTAPTGGGAAVTGCTTPSASRPCVLKWYYFGPTSTIGVSWASGPFIQSQTGIVIACSSTGPFTLTYSANCTFSAEVQ